MSRELIFDLKVNNQQAIESINAFFDIYEKGVKGISSDLSASLGETVDKKVTITLENGKAVAKEIEVIGTTTQKITDANKALNKEYGKTPAELKRQITVLNEIKNNTQKFKGDTAQVSEEWKKVTEAIKGAKAELDKMQNQDGGQNLEDKLIQSQIAADALTGTFKMLAGAAMDFFRSGAEMEILMIQLQGFTGGVQEAAAAYQRFVEIGQATPFSAKEVATAARTMMGFGISSGAAADQTERLATIAAATGGQLNNMARNLGQIQANQKAYTRDLQQFATQGIPIYQAMADILGVSTERIREMTEEGSVGFGLVSAAIRELTQEGTAFAEIAELMDATVGAKLEALMSSVESFAGAFLNMVNKFDQAIGGPLANSLQLVINLFNGLANVASRVARNMEVMAPIIASLVGAFATLIALTIAQNLQAIIAATATWKIVTIAQTVAQNALNASLAIGAALTGNLPALFLAAGVAAAGAAGAYQLWGKKTDEVLNKEEELEFAIVNTTKAIDERVFATKGENKALDEIIEKERERYETAKEGYDIAKQRAQDVVQWVRDQYEAVKEGQEEERQAIRESREEERERHTGRMDDIREYYDEAIGAERELLSQIRERYAEERDDINAKSAAEKQLLAIRRQELTLKAQGVNYQRSAADQAKIEQLQAQAALDRMNRAVALEKNRANEKEAVAAGEEKIKKLEEDKDNAIQAEESKNKIILEGLDRREAKLDKILEEEKKKVKEAQDAYDAKFKNINRAQYETHSEAMQFLNDQIQQASVLEREMISAANNAAEAWINARIEAEKAAAAAAEIASKPGNPYSEATGYWTGGPISGGTVATVNELGKEAFLSSSGQLSRINAPAFGTWRAPSDGTVIPAHLTKHLDIPAGGVKLSHDTEARVSQISLAMQQKRAPNPIIPSVIADGFDIFDQGPENETTMKSKKSPKGITTSSTPALDAITQPSDKAKATANSKKSLKVNVPSDFSANLDTPKQVPDESKKTMGSKKTPKITIPSDFSAGLDMPKQIPDQAKRTVGSKKASKAVVPSGITADLDMSKQISGEAKRTVGSKKALKVVIPSGITPDLDMPRQISDEVRKAMGNKKALKVVIPSDITAGLDIPKQIPDKAKKTMEREKALKVVIPSDITAGLNIPAISANFSRPAAANSVSSSVVKNVVNQGDSISNNVTIQSNNPTQTAGSMMVQLARLKRARYS